MLAYKLESLNQQMNQLIFWIAARVAVCRQKSGAIT